MVVTRGARVPGVPGCPGCLGVLTASAAWARVRTGRAAGWRVARGPRAACAGAPYRSVREARAASVPPTAPCEHRHARRETLQLHSYTAARYTQDQRALLQATGATATATMLIDTGNTTKIMIILTRSEFR